MKIPIIKLLFTLICLFALLFIAYAHVSYYRKEQASLPPKTFGFTTHLFVNNKTYLDENRFGTTVDDLVAHNQKIIRLGLTNEEIAPKGSSNHIEWNYQAIEKYKQAIKYAHKKGLTVYLVTYIPVFAQTYSREDYKKVATLYYRTLAYQFKDDVQVWQIFNEVDFFRYRDYGIMPFREYAVPWTIQYAHDVNDLIAIARNEIKTFNKDAIITTNVGGPMNEQSLIRWQTLYDTIKNNIDIIALDLYPGTTKEVTDIPLYVNTLQKRYHKPVWVSEIGYCNMDRPLTDDEQRAYYIGSIQAVKKSNAAVGIVYQYMDSDNLPNPPICKGAGILRADGTKKPTYNEIMNALR